MGLDLMKYKNKSLERMDCVKSDTYGGPCIGKTDLSIMEERVKLTLLKN